jgi:DNA replication protein DnaC
MKSIETEVETAMEKLKLRARPEAEVRKWEWRYEIVPRLFQAGLPIHFHHEITDWKNDKEEQAVMEVRWRSLEKQIIALVGPRGVGKTTIAAHVIIDFARERKNAYYRKLTDIIAWIKPLYSDYGTKDIQTIIDRRRRYSNFPLLVIDEINESPDSKTSTKMLVDLIDRRYSNDLPTIIITNQTAEDFEESTDESILSRMMERGCILKCEWESWRGK